jgi:homocysteine S-methyltransferase
MRIEDFNERVRDTILIADGAMGSMLYEAAGWQRCFDELNVTQPEAVFRVHHAYIEAGAQIIETNTFGCNRHRLAQNGLSDAVTRLNHAGVKIAREARETAKRDVLIAGSIGPLGIVRQVQSVPVEEKREIFREQAAALEERGVDLFILETFYDLEELLAAIDAVRSFSRLPIVAEMTYSEEGAMLDGTTAAVAWQKLREKDVQAVGANCSIGPQALLPVLQALATVTNLPISAMPNAGFPQRAGDRVVYPKSSPEYFALFAREAAALGVRVLGGCCGTTPEHVRTMAETVKGLHPGRSSARVGAPAAAVAEPAALLEREPESRLWKRFEARQFTVSVEIDPPKGVALDRILDQVGKVMASGHVHLIDINSGALARVGMDALMLAGALEARGIETIPHVTTRDANIIGLQAMLLAAWSVGGVRTILAITGDPPSVGDHPESTGVYEVDSIGLVKILARLNQGADWAGKNLGGGTNYTIGVAVNPLADDLEEEIRRFHAKIEAGAHFAMTQPLFDPEHWHAFVKKIGGSCPIPVMAGIWPLTSYKQALRLNNEVPGIVIPQPVLKEMEAAGTAARERGFALARVMLDWARTELAGAYLIPPFKRYEEILEMFG